MAITGASGAPYAQSLAQQIVNSDAHLHLIISPPGRKLLFDELGLRQVSVATLVGRSVPNATLYAYRDIGATLASGLGDNLIDRAAAVTLKQARRLILVHREMPLSQIDIANMLRLSQAGAVICPASPGFYLLPKTVNDLVDFVVGRVLDLLGVPHDLDIRWEPAESARAASAQESSLRPC